MILATELRIGNLVSNTLGETKVVNTEILVYLLNDKNNEFEPVVLTEELLKFEFDSLGSFGYARGDFKLEFTKNIITTQDCFFIMWIGSRIIRIKYVHQLQNLYFALTGSELTFKTPSNNG